MTYNKSNVRGVCVIFFLTCVERTELAEAVTDVVLDNPIHCVIRDKLLTSFKSVLLTYFCGEMVEHKIKVGGAKITYILSEISF